MSKAVCNLEIANLCHRAVEPFLDEWAQKRPGGAVVAYWDEQKQRVAVAMAKSFAVAEGFIRTLSAEQQGGSVVIDFPEKDQVRMF